MADEKNRYRDRSRSPLYVDVSARDQLLPRFSPPTTPPLPFGMRTRKYNHRSLFVLLVLLFATILFTFVRPSRDPAGFLPFSTGGTSIDSSTSSSSSITKPEFSPEAWLADPSSVNEGLLPFSPTRYNSLLAVRQLAVTPTVAMLSPACLTRWASQGELCPSLKGAWKKKVPVMDFVWTWVNGSEAHMAEWRADVSTNLGPFKPGGDEKGAKVVKHFRDHDELRYSIRSVLTNFPTESIGTLHLVVGDTPSVSPNDSQADSISGMHVAQIPQWMALPTIELGSEEVWEQAGSREEKVLRVHPHSELFKTAVYDSSESDETSTAIEERKADEWRASVVPSFNSLAIETQLPNIPGLTPDCIAMNDDVFLLRDITASDMTSPLLGPLFRMQRDLPVVSSPPGGGSHDPDGEWKGLSETNWMLDQRFGVRSRPYLIHVAKTVSTALWREVQDVFIDEMTLTAESRFRGQRPLEVQSWFLITHYQVEKHREALLWSFFFGRSDVDQDARFSLEEQTSILEALGYTASEDVNVDAPSIIVVPAPRRHTLHTIMQTYDHTGLPLPQQTRLEFSSLDGYAYFEADPAYRRPVPWPSFHTEPDPGATVCIMDIDQCFGEDWAATEDDMSVEDTFRRVAFEKPRCGDCIIAALLNYAPRGMEAFLPPATPGARRPQQEEPLRAEAVGLASTYTSASFTLPPTSAIRDRCIALIQRYAYTIGTSPASFVAVRSTAVLETNIARMDKEGPPAFLALNDDVVDAEDPSNQGIDAMFSSWMKGMFPDPSRWES